MKLYDNDAYRENFMSAVYDIFASDGTNDRANQIIYLFDSAPAVEAEPIVSNDPLTLNELRKMIGEPVWVEDETKDYLYWAVVIPEWEIYGIYEKYGETWKAYRRKRMKKNETNPIQHRNGPRHSGWQKDGDVAGV